MYSICLQVAIVLCMLVAYAAAGAVYVGAPALVRAPAYDSAVITSNRLGGNFAYSTVEAQAYAAVSPVVQNVATPVAVSYHATPLLAPAPLLAHAPVPAYYHR